MTKSCTKRRQSVAWHTTRLAALAGLALLGALAGCSAGKTPDVPPPLEGAAIGGPFTLTDQDGKTVRNSDFDGKFRIIYFGYTYCPDVCPLDLQAVSKGFARFEQQHPDRAKDIQPIFISVDPERDTPPVLKQYVSAFHPRLIGLTGPLDTIRKVARAYAVTFEKVEDKGASGYLISHSRQAYVFGRRGEPLALLSYDKDPDAIAAEIDQWTR